MAVDIPFFLTNKEWYKVNSDGCYVLTDKAPKEAIDSYKEWLDEDEVDINDVRVINM